MYLVFLANLPVLRQHIPILGGLLLLMMVLRWMKENSSFFVMYVIPVPQIGWS